MSEPTIKAIPPVRRLPAPTMLAYGSGAIAYGVKDLSFSTFLLLFYNQVIGLPAAEVGFAIMCALLLDAFIDPAIGFLSDRTRGRWGRRHPWMYASALPVAIGWLLLWNPPEWGQGALLLYVFGSALLVRVALSMFEIPGWLIGWRPGSVGSRSRISGPPPRLSPAYANGSHISL